MLTPSSVCAYWIRGSMADVFYITSTVRAEREAALTANSVTWPPEITTDRWRAPVLEREKGLEPSTLCLGSKDEHAVSRGSR